MKSLIAVAVAAVFALPAYAQNTTLPNAQERAQNREAVQDKSNEVKGALPSASERAENREAVKDKTNEVKGALPNANERAENRDRASGMAASAALTTKVKTALASDVGMRTVMSIDVDSNDGVVTLKGKVPTADAKKKAEDIAKKVDGVKSVKNELTVEPEKKG